MSIFIQANKQDLEIVLKGCMSKDIQINLIEEVRKTWVN